MANALENEIIGRGFDPRDFVLMSYGGAGPFHAAGYAASLGVDTIVVPGEAASVWSAFGISQADIRYQYEASVVLIEPFDAGELEQAFGELEARRRAALSEREDVEPFEFRRYARMRFQWQRHELEMRLPDGDDRRRRCWRRSSASSSAIYTERYGEVALLPGATRGDRLDPAGAGDHDGLRQPRPARGRRGRVPQGHPRGVLRARRRAPSTPPIYNGDAMPLGEAVDGPGGDRPGDHRHRRPARDASCERRKTGDFVLTLDRG